MFNRKIIRVIGLVALLAITGLAQSSIMDSRIDDDQQRTPDLPSPVCDSVQAPPGNKMSAHVYATGVQIYKWNGTSWDFIAPVARLFADANFHGSIGIHYAGPTWESNSGSKVVARRLTGCTPDSTAIPWLLLQTVSAEGPGIFNRVTYIQRVNTAGGLAPGAPGPFIGAEARIPYTAEYYFYRAEN